MVIYGSGPETSLNQGVSLRAWSVDQAMYTWPQWSVGLVISDAFSGEWVGIACAIAIYANYHNTLR